MESKRGPMPDDAKTEEEQVAVVLLDARWSMAEYQGEDGLVMGIQFNHPSTGVTLLCMNDDSLTAMIRACNAALDRRKFLGSDIGGRA